MKLEVVEEWAAFGRLWNGLVDHAASVYETWKSHWIGDAKAGDVKEEVATEVKKSLLMRRDLLICSATENRNCLFWILVVSRCRFANRDYIVRPEKVVAAVKWLHLVFC